MSALKKPGRPRGPIRKSRPCALGNRWGGGEEVEGYVQLVETAREVGDFQAGQARAEAAPVVAAWQAQVHLLHLGLDAGQVEAGSAVEAEAVGARVEAGDLEGLARERMVAVCAPTPFASIEPPWIVKSKRSRNRIERSGRRSRSRH